MFSIDNLLPQPRERPKANREHSGAVIRTPLHASVRSHNSSDSTRAVAVARPSPEEVEATRQRTKAALDLVLESRNQVETRQSPSIVEYQAPQPGAESSVAKTIRVVDVQYDPLEPARHKHVKAPPRPPSPPAPVLSQPAELSAEEQRKWQIPSSLSGWKNNKGFVVSVEKRVAADGRSIEAAEEPGHRMEALAEALYNAEHTAREEVNQRKRETEEANARALESKELRLKLLAKRARKEPEDGGYEDRKRSRRQRLNAARTDQDRDVAERAALGQTPLTGDSQFDSRLFSKPSNESDEPLFAAQQAVRTIYNPKNDTGPVEFER